MICYAYDQWGNPKTLKYPNNKVVEYGFDHLGRITRLTYDGAEVVKNVQFDEWGNRKELEFHSGAYSRWSTKEGKGLFLDEWTVGYQSIPFPGGTRKFLFDKGDRLSQAGEWTLYHDAAGRMRQASFKAQVPGDPAEFSTGHNYDAYGNVIGHFVDDPALKTFNSFDLGAMPYNRMPRHPEGQFSPTGWAYPTTTNNDDGEPTTIGSAQGAPDIISLTWDGLGRLTRARMTTAKQDYTYAPSGLRVGLVDTVDTSRNRRYAYTAGGMLLSEYLWAGAATAAWKRDVIYLGGQAVVEVDSLGVHELHSDHLGSPRVVTKGATGEIEGRQAYGAYGETIRNSDPGYIPLTGYTGHIQTDATNLIYMRGRYYTPAWHRFLNSDHGVDPNQWNQFAYVGGSPFMATDPSGMFLT